MTLSPRFLDELRSRLTLSEVASKRVRLTRAGREFKGCCPFHTEKTPSFYINDDKQFYHCFGCGAHGDVVGFVMRHDNLSFIEAVEQLAALAGVQVPKADPREVERAQKEKSLHSLMEDATRWMEQQLRAPENRTAYDYILQRGVSEEALYAFRIGYAPADRQLLRTHLKSLDYTDAQMIEAGVIRPPGKDGEPYAFFRERIMFPVPDRRGRVVAFGGRILPDHLRPPDRGDYKPAKYMNSSDTPLFHKGRMLYGEPHARKAAADNEPIIVVEGYLDVIASFKAGFRGAVAPLGTALTDEQIMVLWKMIPSDEKVPVLCFDGDEAGRRAAARACENVLPMLKANHSVRIAFLPEGQDPDTLVAGQGAGALKAVINGAMPLIEFLWSHHTQGRRFDTPEARAGLSQLMEEEVARIPDRDVQHFYRQALREKIRKAFGPVFTPGYGGKGRGSKNNPQNRLQAGAGLRNPAFSRAGVMQTSLMAALLNYPSIFHYLEEDFSSLEMFGDPGLDKLRQTTISALMDPDDEPLDAAGLNDYLNAAGFDGELKRVLSESVYTHAAFARPGRDENDVLEGCRQALDALRKAQAAEEIRAVGGAFAKDFSEETESRLLALHRMRSASEGQG